MCKISNELIFCSCQNTQGIEEELMGVHQWTLDRYVGSKETCLRGRLMMPSDLDNQIKIKEVIHEMNTRNCFDFDYVPQERDCFQINNGLKHPDYKYFSLVYKKGKWEKGRNPAFGATISKNIATGKVKHTPNKP